MIMYKCLNILMLALNNLEFWRQVYSFCEIEILSSFKIKGADFILQVPKYG